MRVYCINIFEILPYEFWKRSEENKDISLFSLLTYLHN